MYSLNGTLVVYGYEHFDGLTPPEKYDALLLPKRNASNESELNELLENSFCTMSRITFDDLRNYNNNTEYDIVGDDDEYYAVLGNDLLISPDYYVESDNEYDATNSNFNDLTIPVQNCSIPNDALIRFYIRNKCTSTHVDQLCVAINIVCIVFYIL